MTVAEAFCARQNCAPTQYQERAFRLCLYARAVPVAFVLYSLSPKLFREDRLVIQQVGLARDLEEVDAALSDFHYVNHARRHWLRTGLKLRISGRKVRLLAASLLEPTDSENRSPLPVPVGAQAHDGAGDR